MDQKSFILNTEYRLIERLPVLGGNRLMILCEDAERSRFLCAEDTWQSGAPEDCTTVPKVTANSSAHDKISLFLALFRGREDVYAKRYVNTKTKKSGYVPACQNEWIPGVCDKRSYKCPACPHRAFRLLTEDVAKAHLLGRDSLCRDVVGIYPMLEDDQTYLLAADFDEQDWQLDVAAFRETCLDYGLTPAVERSRSGQGAHIRFFFSESIPAASARRLGSGLLTRTMERRHELAFQSYDRLFPSQDTVPKGGFGDLIALPFQGQAQKNGNSLFVNERFLPYTDQWAFLSTLPKITPEQLDECLSGLCTDGETGILTEDTQQSTWPTRRRRGRLTHDDFPIQVRLMVSNLLYVDKTGFSQKALNTVKRLAAFHNPDFYKKQAMRLRIYDTPRVIDCGYEDKQFLGIPRGCMDAMAGLLETHDVPFTLEDRRQSGRPIDVSFVGALRAEQIPAAKSLLAEDMGVLSATTAFGKTVVGAYLIGQRKVNTLILVHSSALLAQWKVSLEQFLEVREVLPEPPKKRGRKKKQYLIGQIGGGKHVRSGIVDIAIMQSLFEGEEKEVSSFVAEYGMVIVDECHHVAAFTFEKILRTAEAKFVYGLSATPVRQDGHQPIIFMQCGPIRYLVDAKSQAEARSFSHFVIPHFTRTRLPNANGIQDVYSGIINSESRNEMICADARRLVAEGRTPLLLTERRAHAIQLYTALQDTAQHIVLLLGSDSQKEKRERLHILHTVPPEDSLIVIATGKYIGEGFDEPRLDTMLLVMPVSWKGTLAQYAGRLHRNYEGKQEVRIYDYVDVHVPVLERMYHRRLRGYADLGYEIKLSERDSISSKIHTSKEYMAAFSDDLSNAAKSILIASPYLQMSRVTGLSPVLENAITNGIPITIYTKPIDSYHFEQQNGTSTAIAQLEQLGVSVVFQAKLQQRYAIFDQSIVWYGNINFLAFSGKESDTLRFESTEIAGELLEEFEQNFSLL